MTLATTYLRVGSPSCGSRLITGIPSPTPDPETRPQTPRRPARGYSGAPLPAEDVVVHRRPGGAPSLGVDRVRRAVVGAWFEQLRVRLRSGNRWPRRVKVEVVVHEEDSTTRPT